MADKKESFFSTPDDRIEDVSLTVREISKQFAFPALSKLLTLGLGGPAAMLATAIDVIEALSTLDELRYKKVNDWMELYEKYYKFQTDTDLPRDDTSILSRGGFTDTMAASQAKQFYDILNSLWEQEQNLKTEFDKLSAGVITEDQLIEKNSARYKTLTEIANALKLEVKPNTAKLGDLIRKKIAASTPSDSELQSIVDSIQIPNVLDSLKLDLLNTIDYSNFTASPPLVLSPLTYSGQIPDYSGQILGGGPSTSLEQLKEEILASSQAANRQFNLDFLTNPLPPFDYGLDEDQSGLDNIGLSSLLGPQPSLMDSSNLPPTPEAITSTPSLDGWTTFKDGMGGILGDLSGEFGLYKMALDGVGEAWEKMITGQGGGQAFKQLAVSILSTLSKQSVVQALFETAQGLAALARGDGPGAGTHFAAAKFFAAVAVASGVATAALSSGANGSGGSTSAGSGTSATGPTSNAYNSANSGTYQSGGIFSSQEKVFVDLTEAVNSLKSQPAGVVVRQGVSESGGVAQIMNDNDRQTLSSEILQSRYA